MAGERGAIPQVEAETVPDPATPESVQAVELKANAGQAACLEEQPNRNGAEEQNDDQLPKEELESDSFRMFSFKVVQCKNHDDTHDWTECPFAHIGEKANRRDPRLFRYTGISCPDYRKGACKRGSICPYAHGVFEVWLHPSRYRTQLCKDAPHCTRQVCFFAHSPDELRQAAPEDVPVLESGSTSSSTAGSETGSEATSSAGSISSSDSDSSSDSNGPVAARKGAAGSERPEAAAGAPGASGSSNSRGQAPTASKLQQLKAAGQPKQQQSLDWAAALSDPKLLMSRQASTASTASSSHAVLGLDSFSSFGSNASMVLSGMSVAGAQKQLQGLPLDGAGGPGNRLLRVPLDIAAEAAAVAASAGVIPLCDTFGSLDVSAVACHSPPVGQQHHQQTLGVIGGLAMEAAAPWSSVLAAAAPQMSSSPADVAARAAAVAAAAASTHMSVLQQLSGLTGGSPALAASVAAQQVVASQHQEMLQAVLLHQQQQQQQRDAMWTAAYNAAADVGLNPLTAAACADCAVQSAAASCGLQHPAIATCGTTASQLQLQLLLQQQQASMAAATAVPVCAPLAAPAVHSAAGLGLAHVQQQAMLGAGPADALFVQKQLAAAGGLLGGVPGMTSVCSLPGPVGAFGLY